MVAAVAATSNPNPLTGRGSELPHHGWRDDLVAVAFECGGDSLRFGLRLVADRLEAGYPVLERGVVQIGDAAFDRIVKPLEPQIGFGRPLVPFGDVISAAFGALVAAIQNGCQYFLKPLGLKQPVLDMAGNQVVQLLHRD